MKFPFTYHSKKTNRLVSINTDDEYRIENMEVWDELNNHWIPVNTDAQDYDTYLSDFREELNHNIIYE